jgi:hypothetical protein
MNFQWNVESELGDWNFVDVVVGVVELFAVIPATSIR